MDLRYFHIHVWKLIKTESEISSNRVYENFPKTRLRKTPRYFKDHEYRRGEEVLAERNNWKEGAKKLLDRSIWNEKKNRSLKIVSRHENSYYFKVVHPAISIFQSYNGEGGRVSSRWAIIRAESGPSNKLRIEYLRDPRNYRSVT